MKKKILLILMIVLVLTGCNKRGEIEESHPELYYIRTNYYSQAFAVLHDTADAGQHKVAITIDPELEAGSIIDATPNTYIIVTIPDEKYNELINGAEVFEGTFSLFTIVNPKNRHVYMYLEEPDVSTETVLRKALYDKNELAQLSKDDFAPYLEKYRFLYWKF